MKRYIVLKEDFEDRISKSKLVNKAVDLHNKCDNYFEFIFDRNRWSYSTIDKYANYLSIFYSFISKNLNKMIIESKVKLDKEDLKRIKQNLNSAIKKLNSSNYDESTLNSAQSNLHSILDYFL